MRNFIFTMAICLLAATSCCNSPKNAAECDKCCADKNPVIETIMSRRSIRAYTDQVVPRELIDQIVECGIYAPNGMNAQQWELRIVDSKEWLDNTTEAVRQSVKGTPMEKQFEGPSFKNMFRNAPVVIFIAHKPGPCTQIDCGLLAGNMILTAQSLGLGSICMMGPLMSLKSEAGKPILESLGFSDGYEPLLCVGIGYADQQPEPTPRNREVVKYVE